MGSLDLAICGCKTNGALPAGAPLPGGGKLGGQSETSVVPGRFWTMYGLPRVVFEFGNLCWHELMSPSCKSMALLAAILASLSCSYALVGATGGATGGAFFLDALWMLQYFLGGPHNPSIIQSLGERCRHLPPHTSHIGNTIGHMGQRRARIGNDSLVLAKGASSYQTQCLGAHGRSVREPSTASE